MDRAKKIKVRSLVTIIIGLIVAALGYFNYMDADEMIQLDVDRLDQVRLK